MALEEPSQAARTLFEPELADGEMLIWARRAHPWSRWLWIPLGALFAFCAWSTWILSPALSGTTLLSFIGTNGVSLALAFYLMKQTQRAYVGLSDRYVYAGWRFIGRQIEHWHITDLGEFEVHKKKRGRGTLVFTSTELTDRQWWIPGHGIFQRRLELTSDDIDAFRNLFAKTQRDYVPAPSGFGSRRR